MMQVKPRFETFKILEEYPFMKDDLGNVMCLTLLEVKLPTDESEIIETTYKYWCIAGKKQEQWGNKSISYSSIAFWKAKKKDKLFKDVVNEFTIEEVECGEHTMFDNADFGLRTTFKIKRVTIKQNDTRKN